MRRPLSRVLTLLLVLTTLLLPAATSLAQPVPLPDRGRSTLHGFTIEEATIAEVHEAFRRRRLTCVDLVQGYLDRIAAYDDAGPALNAIIAVNPTALDTARAMDAAYRRSGSTGSLHCVPMLIKDNLDTADMETTAGSRSLEGTPPPQDSFVVEQLREAGAIVLAKANLDEFARGASGLSSVGGQTRNPYDPDHIPGGSSAGTGAGVAANFALAGIGTETGVSIRNPSTNNNLVGIAPTRGLVSQAGIVPISFTQDRAGPIAKTVDDAARILDVIAGFDPRDGQTALSVGRVPDTYVPAPARGRGRQVGRGTDPPRRVGVVRELFGDQPAEAESGTIVDEAIDDLAAEGVTVVDAVPMQEALDEALQRLDPLFPDDDTSLVRVLSDARTNNYEFRFAMNDYLTERGPTSPRSDLADIIDSGLVPPNVLNGLRSSQDGLGLDDPEYHERLLRIAALQRATLEVMAELDLDGLVYPMKTQTAAEIGGSSQPSRIASSGNVLSSITGFPSVVVPAGFAGDGLPVALEIAGRPFTEDVLTEIAAVYEAATGHRTLPPTTPPLD